MPEGQREIAVRVASFVEIALRVPADDAFGVRPRCAISPTPASKTEEETAFSIGGHEAQDPAHASLP